MFAQDKYGAWEQGRARATTDTDRVRGTEVRGGNINRELMVQLKAHLYNRWPWLNILSLPIESDRADNDPSPPTVLLTRPERALLVAELWRTGFTAHTHTSSEYSNKENQGFWPHTTEVYKTCSEGSMQPYIVTSDSTSDPHSKGSVN